MNKNCIYICAEMLSRDRLCLEATSVNEMMLKSGYSQ